MNDVRMNVWKVLFDPNIGTSVVLLRDNNERILPIWIGQPEALSIAMATEQVTMERPMTHDLLKSTIETLGYSMTWIRVHDLIDGTFYATIRLNGPGGEMDIDSRPSDAIALALRMNGAIFVAEKVLTETLKSGSGVPSNIEDLDEDFLKDLPDGVFGKYKM